MSNIPVSFPLFEAPLKVSFWHGGRLKRCISFNVISIFISQPGGGFSVLDKSVFTNPLHNVDVSQGQFLSVV